MFVLVSAVRQLRQLGLPRNSFRPSTASLSSKTSAEGNNLFFDEKVTEILKTLSGKNLDKVFKRRRDGKKLKDAVHKFMTTAQLEKAVAVAERRADALLQMPPMVREREEIDHLLVKDDKLEGLLQSKLIISDISLGKTDRTRTIVVRNAKGTLRLAGWEERSRMNQIYFPRPGRELWPPVMFQEEYLLPLFEQKQYSFVLDRACAQFEPDDPEYLRITSATYEAINASAQFNVLRSTRHFGPLVFYLALNNKLDELLVENLQTGRLEEAGLAVRLHSRLHLETGINPEETTSDLDLVKAFVAICSKDRGKLELAYVAARDFLASPKLPATKFVRAL